MFPWNDGAVRRTMKTGDILRATINLVGLAQLQ